ncbi:MAG: hypothetical protein LBL97_05645 [Prevotellaceae bacterium]|jgi:tetratricopeptide (TPR) repeat protein|nr:hypothetical protein [Prevotellaceae bacterium]
MTKDVINQQYRAITRLLDAKRLNEAFAQIEGFLHSGTLKSYLPKLEELKISYQYMLQYMRQGVKDPERHHLYLQLLAKAYELAEHARINLLDEFVDNYYHRYRYKNELAQAYSLNISLQFLRDIKFPVHPDTLPPKEYPDLREIQVKHGLTIAAMFINAWCNDAWSTDEEQYALQFLTEPIRETDLSLLVSAATLSVMECFDEHKVRFLLEATLSPCEEVAQRAYIGLILIIDRHPTRIELYPEINARISLMFDSKLLTDIYIQLLYSQEAKKIERIMNDEIVPAVLKTAQKIRNMEQEDPEDNDINPDWESTFDPELTDKMREMTEVHLAGGDIYLSAFNQMKNHPFFRQPQNWLYMFDPIDPNVYDLFSQSPDLMKNALYRLLMMGRFSNSDKYSFCLTIHLATKGQQNAILSQIPEADNEMYNDPASKADVSGIRSQYIHDLYRFFTVSNFHSEAFGIFDKRIELHRLALLKEMFEAEDLKSIADFLFQKERTEEASNLYNLLLNSKTLPQAAIVEVYQKSGYCLQKEKRYEEALNRYKYADAISTDNLWTMRHIAACYRLLKRYRPAIEAYHRVEAVEPDNRNVTLQLGNCYTETGQPQEALKYFFKLEFLDENNPKAWRGIAWCSLISGKHEQAKKYYLKLLAADKPSMSDYLNAGHTAWVMKDTEHAIRHYGKALALCEDRDTFLMFFGKDQSTLTRQGIDKDAIPLMLDLI